MQTKPLPAADQRRIPLEPRVIGPMLARQRCLSPFRLTIETTAHGDTRAWLERRALQAVRS